MLKFAIAAAATIVAVTGAQAQSIKDPRTGANQMAQAGSGFREIRVETGLTQAAVANDRRALAGEATRPGANAAPAPRAGRVDIIRPPTSVAGQLPDAADPTAKPGTDSASSQIAPGAPPPSATPQPIAIDLPVPGAASGEPGQETQPKPAAAN